MLLLSLPGLATAAELTPPSPGLGERADLVLSVAPLDSTDVPVGIGVVVLPTADPLRFAAQPIRVGQVGITIPASADTLWWEVPRTIEQAAPERLRPLKSLGPIQPNWWPSILIAAAVLLPLLYWLWRRWQRRPRRQAAFAIPVEPPHEMALRRLRQIAGTAWLRDGEFDRYYVEASHTVRSYLAGRYRVPALDWTSREVVDRMGAAGYDRSSVTPVSELLLEADEVKFAAGRPTEHAAQEWLQRAERFVEETAIDPVFSTAEAIAAAKDFNAEAGS